MPIVDAVRAAFPALPEKDPRQMAPLVLAYIGDTVYDLYMRTRLVLKTDSTAHGLHMAAAKLVCAAAQAAAYRRMADALTEEETAVFKRGRNAHMGTVPKNASIADYRAATGLEALMGYLYLCGRDERIEELMSLALKED
ncbi:MAG: Mini-ribonuclease 3 [Clostridia bacterium]|nr:Mini-ribonuclease 3 [Clostridia bacterium]MBR0026715.1 Mini-ribonuclease 3 [Clostridia bacterium]